jgi:hypothetical protein
MFNKFCNTFEIPLLSLSEYIIIGHSEILMFMATIKCDIHNWLEYEHLCAYE